MVQCDKCSVKCALYSVQFSVNSVLFAVCIVQCAVFSVLWAVCSVHFAASRVNVQCAMCSAMCSVQCSVHLHDPSRHKVGGTAQNTVSVYYQWLEAWKISPEVPDSVFLNCFAKNLND